MGNKLAIKGHPIRSKEVIALLEMMGGKNHSNIGNDNDFFYYINDKNNIEFGWTMWDNNPLYTIFTLEEFLEKYPFKVGDKVTLDNKLCTITWMCWECNNVYYQVQEIDSMFIKKVVASELKPYKEKNMHNEKSNREVINPMKNVLAELLEHIKTTPKEELEKEFNELEEWSNVGPTVEEFMDFCNKVNKKPVYPKTYDECCKNVLKMVHWGMTVDVPMHYSPLIINFTKLLICRDAYWKIAGDEMGLGKPWEPDLENEELYCIQNYNKQITISRTNTAFNKILIFPNEKLRDMFYENFKDLIEQCKELL